jgi:hypothetical protein
MKAAIPTNKILIALLFWEGDKNQAMKLARLLADLEPAHSEAADFLFVARFDCQHDENTIRHVSRKFNVHRHTSKRRGTGWPMGCNAIFFGMLEWAYHKMNAHLVPGYKAILVLGGDGAPLKADWIPAFVNNVKPGVFVSGALIPDPVNGHDHINGDCALLSGDLKFLKWLTLGIGDVSTVAGWDWILSEDFKRWGWQDLPFVKSVWNRPGRFTQEDWEREGTSGVIWYHGVKRDDLLELARKNLL